MADQLISLADYARRLDVTGERVKQLCRLLEITPVKAEGRWWLLLEDAEKISVYRQRPRFQGYVSLLDLTRKLGVTYGRVQQYLTHLEIKPVELYKGYLYVTQKQRTAVRMLHYHGRLPSHSDFERRVEKAVAAVLQQLKPELIGLREYIDEQMLNVAGELEECKQLLAEIQQGNGD